MTRDCVSVATIFSLAHKLQPAIIFIDEVDSFLGQRRSSDNDAFTTDSEYSHFNCLVHLKTDCYNIYILFLTETARVMVLAATNWPSDLNEAILRQLDGFPRLLRLVNLDRPIEQRYSK